MKVAKLNHNRITICGNISKGEFSGSSSYCVLNNQIILKKEARASQIIGDYETGYVTTLGELEESVKVCKLTKEEREELRALRELAKDYEAPQKKMIEYKLNKKLVYDKALAFSQLRQSARFMAFYSISFPAGMSVDDIFKAWNKFLTNCRKYYGLCDYLWVSEYQKNGTLHFHLLTNNYMAIRKVNSSMATVLFNQGELTDEQRAKYNGVDVKRVNGDKKRVISYITKYVSKQEDVRFTRRPWYCSQSISALNTARMLTNEELDAVRAQMEDDNVCPYVYENEYVQIFFINQKIDDKKGYYNLPARFYARLKYFNQLIFDDYKKRQYETKKR